MTYYYVDIGLGIDFQGIQAMVALKIACARRRQREIGMIKVDTERMHIIVIRRPWVLYSDLYNTYI